MKKISLGLNIVLILAVAGIYYLHFSGNKVSNKEIGEDDLSKVTGIEKETVIKYIDALVKREELKKEDGKYILTGKFTP